MNFTINISQDANSDVTELINDYWLITNNDFTYNLNQLIEKYNLTSHEITKLVKKYSVCEASTYCSDCNKIFLRSVETKGFFKISKYNKILCVDCLENEKILKKEREKKQEEELQRRRYIYIQNNEEKKRKFAEAIQTKQWLDLNAFELDILIKIIENRGIKKAVRDNVFNGNFYDQYIWSIINKLERKGLIFVDKVPPNNKVMGFEYDSSLIFHINEKKSIDIIDYLSFSLSKRSSEKTNLRQPDYSGTFILPCEVVLKANEKYLYGGWVLTDGSINLKFTPIKDIKRVEQTKIDDESDSYENETNQMFSSLDDI